MSTREEASRQAEAKQGGTPEAQDRQVRGYGQGGVETVISVEDVNRQAAKLSSGGIAVEKLAALAGAEPFVKIEGLRAGYGKMQILHSFNLQVGRGQSLCLIGPNGAGKSTVLHSIFGFTNIYGGAVVVNGRDVTKLSPKDKTLRWSNTMSARLTSSLASMPYRSTVDRDI
jgi:branched-chain amino acid transport system ATP-binding protein